MVIYKYHTFVLKSKKKKLTLTLFFISVKKHDWVIQDWVTDDSNKLIKILQFRSRGKIQKISI